MPRLSAFLLCPLLVAPLGLAPPPVFRERPDDSESVLRRLQGTWSMSRFEIRGRTVNGEGEVFTIRIENDLWTSFHSANGSRVSEMDRFTLKLDPKASPAEIDFTHRSLPVGWRGVYSLKGDTLKIVFREYDLKGDTAKILYPPNVNGKKDRARNLLDPGPRDYFMQLERDP